MFDPLQIGAQVWTPDRGADIPPRGGTVVAVDERADRVLVIARTPVRARGKGRAGVTYTVETDWVDVADLDLTMTQPAHARMADRRKLARHLFHVLGDGRGDWTQRDLDMLGWARALLETPPPTRYREPGYGDLPAELAAALRDPIEPGEPGYEWPIVVDDRVPPGVAIVEGVGIFTTAVGAGALERARAAAERNGIDPDLVTAGPSGGVVIDLAGLLDASIDAHRARR